MTISRSSLRPLTRRQLLIQAAGAGGVALLETGALHAAPAPAKAQIAITLDLEMARNFPKWTDTHWDYEKGNVNDAAKQYAVSACRRVKQRGGLIHTFVVGQALEQENVDWLKEIAAEGHPIGNHTYHHVYMLAATPAHAQFRFQRSPWLIGNRSVAELLRDNIALTNAALKERIGVKANGFRTPGGFANGLHGREDLQQMLLGLGFDWISCVYPVHDIVDLHGVGQSPAASTVDSILAGQKNAQPFRYPTGLIDVPMSPISDIGAFRNGRWRLDDFLEVTRRAVSWAIEHRAAFDFLSHPSCLGVVDPEFKTYDLICDLVEKAGDAAEIVTLDIIARRFTARNKQPS
jgi:peptidoglycan/xylan/chitin deacetylase (PgdA/CDA1 family)